MLLYILLMGPTTVDTDFIVDMADICYFLTNSKLLNNNSKIIDNELNNLVKLCMEYSEKVKQIDLFTNNHNQYRELNTKYARMVNPKLTDHAKDVILQLALDSSGYFCIHNRLIQHIIKCDIAKKICMPFNKSC